jgi:hypothetical protein
MEWTQPKVGLCANAGVCCRRVQAKAGEGGRDKAERTMVPKATLGISDVWLQTHSTDKGATSSKFVGAHNARSESLL